MTIENLIDKILITNKIFKNIQERKKIVEENDCFIMRSIQPSIWVRD